ncbi:cytochrome-c peroxidase [Bradyrhizobium barranii]
MQAAPRRRTVRISYCALATLLYLAIRAAASDAPPEVPAFAPLELPAPTADAAFSAKIELGRMLFFDSRLSGDASISCASCHDSSQGWAFADQLSRGYPGTMNWRNSPTVVNAALLRRLFWTGHANSLEEQAKAAGTGPIEMHGNPKLIEARLATVPDYRRRFSALFGTETPRSPDIWNAIAAFEATVVQNDTPFDRYLRGEKNALAADQSRGFALFRGKAGCAGCHNGPLLTDELFYNTGVPATSRWATDTLAKISFDFMQAELGVTSYALDDDAGRFLYTKQPDDLGKFRTAPLRYTMYTAPYMHNGAFETLRDVVEFYNRGGGTNSFAGTKSSKIVPLGLRDDEVADLARFLESLSGKEIRIARPALPPYPSVPAP